MRLTQPLYAFLLAGSIAFPALGQDPIQKPAPQPATTEKPATATEATSEKPKAPLQIGARLDGTVSLPDIDGKVHTAKSFQGNVTVVNFWSTKCPVMQAYENTYTSIQEDYAKKGINFLHVNSNEANGEIADGTPKDEKAKPYQSIRDYLAKQKLERRVLIDHDSKFADLLGAKTTPDVFVFDDTGMLQYRGLIDTNYDGKQGDKTQHHLRNVLDALLKGEKSPLQATMPRGCSIKRTMKPKATRKPIEKMSPKPVTDVPGSKSKT